jgi:hypothetical protein
VRYGYRRLTVLLKREGWEVNAKRIYRLYTEEGLIVRTQKRAHQLLTREATLFLQGGQQLARCWQLKSFAFIIQRLVELSRTDC